MSDYTPELPPLAAYGPATSTTPRSPTVTAATATRGTATGRRPPAAGPPRTSTPKQRPRRSAPPPRPAPPSTWSTPPTSTGMATSNIRHAIRTIHARGEPVDQVTVAHELGGPRRRRRPAALTSLIAATPGTRNADRYARIISDMALLRRITAVANEIATQAYELPDDPGARRHRRRSPPAPHLHPVRRRRPRLIAGDRFILDTPPGVPAIWGDDTGNVPGPKAKASSSSARPASANHPRRPTPSSAPRPPPRPPRLPHPPHRRPRPLPRLRPAPTDRPRPQPAHRPH